MAALALTVYVAVQNSCWYPVAIKNQTLDIYLIFQCLPGLFQNSRTVRQRDGLHDEEDFGQALQVVVGLGYVVDDCSRSCIRLLTEEGWDWSGGHIAVEEIAFQRPGCEPDSRNVVPVKQKKIELAYYKNKFDNA